MTSTNMLYMAFTLIIGVFIIVDFFKSRYQRWRFSGMALLYSGIVAGLSAFNLAWSLWMEKSLNGLLLNALSIGLSFLFMYVYLSCGQRYNWLMGHLGSVNWKKFCKVSFTNNEVENRQYQIHELSSKAGTILYKEALHPQSVELVPIFREEMDSLSKAWWIRFASVVAITVAGFSIYTILLFYITKPEASEAIKAIQDTVQNGHDAFDVSPVFLGIFFTNVALSEEIFFRMAAQSFLEWRFRMHSYSAWIAVVLTSFIWSIGHFGVLSPDWIKFAQIFPFGLTLGVIQRKYGFEAVAMVHILFNWSMIFLTPNILTIQ